MLKKKSIKLLALTAFSYTGLKLPTRRVVVSPTNRIQSMLQSDTILRCARYAATNSNQIGNPASR